MAIDQLGHYYTQDSLGGLYKYSPQGKQLFYYQNRTLGNGFQIDVRDPFSILLYYQEYTALIYLDRTLNELAQYNLASQGFLGVSQVATAQDNQVWIYDPQDFSLKKIDPYGRVLKKSQDLSLQIGSGLQIEDILVSNAQVYLRTPTGLLRFNLFGQFQKEIILPSGQVLQVKERSVLLKTEQSIQEYVFFPGNQQTLFNTDRLMAQLFLRNQRVYASSLGKVWIYSLKE